MNLNEFFDKGEKVTYPAKSILLREGEICKSWMYLKTGVCRHCFITNDGVDATKNFVTENHFIFPSISSYIEKKASRVEFQAITKCEVIKWTVSDFNDFVNSTEGQTIFNQMMRDLVIKKEEKEISILKDCSEKRYLNFMEKNGFLFNLIPHYYIASYLNIAPETLSRLRFKCKL